MKDEIFVRIEGKKTLPDPTVVPGGGAAADIGSVSVGNDGDVVRINGGGFNLSEG